MARLLICFFIVMVFMASSSSSSSSPISSRKLLGMMKKQEMAVREEKKSHVPHVTKSTTLASLPKGKVPSNSAPSKKGHSAIANHKLFARHLYSIGRLLRSVPSPAFGH
ncbi:PREDICTED: uncharacterized protein LOC104820608 [Tarenaya hassleriana]|uniref:uncharacterized protein LOC104820608 n=1 Tax=Tarenaya hassleriana TaxID=28532 RepID=UPI00053C44CC|nr:PREDICTED: uncharacterized protein LOC104820608 [Tarenaya hassleriana]